MKKLFILLSGFSLFCFSSYSQIGNVGIGTTTPSDRLEVAREGSIDLGAHFGWNRMVLTNLHNMGLANGGNHSIGSKILFKGYKDAALSAPQNIYSLGIDVFGDVTSTVQKNNFFIRDEYASGSPVRLLIDATGNVGIGTPTPVLKLEVVGLNVAAATSGSAANGIVRIHPSGSNLVMDIGTFSSTGAHGWIQMRESNDYSSSNWPLSLNPNGGNVGIATTTPAASAQLDVSSTTKGFLPPRMTVAQRNSIVSPAAGLMIYCTNCGGNGEWQGYNGTAWTNMVGGTAALPLAIGTAYQGGIIAYILVSGDPGYDANVSHGLIAAVSDQSTGAQWGCSGTAIPGADGTALGTGNQNTIDIMAGCATAGIAARICGDLVLNGFSDWYLPSKDELNKLYINRVAVGGFASGNYWSSSENVTSNAWDQTFSTGFQGINSKLISNRVRAVRAF